MKTLKKVLVYGISGSFGGIESFIFNVISNINKREIEFNILTYYDNISYMQDYKKMGVKIFKITSKHENLIKNHFELKNFFKEHMNEYDVIWCNLAELINIDILKFAKKYGVKKRIIHSHSATSTRGKLLTYLHKKNRRKISNIATDYWACSLSAGKWFYSDNILKCEKFCIIKNAIDTGKFIYNENNRNNVRKELGLEESFVVGNVGRFSILEKNTLFMLDIFSEILKLKSNSKLLIVGDGNDRSLVEAKIDNLNIRDNTILLGYRNDVEKYLNAMDVFLLPSNFEGLGIVLIEAQASGLKCFTSAKVVPKEVAVTDLVSFIDLSKNPKEWAKQIVDSKQYIRQSRTNSIIDSGYGIFEETKRIRDLIEE